MRVYIAIPFSRTSTILSGPIGDGQSVRAGSRRMSDEAATEIDSWTIDVLHRTSMDSFDSFDRDGQWSMAGGRSTINRAVGARHWLRRFG